MLILCADVLKVLLVLNLFRVLNVYFSASRVTVLGGVPKYEACPESKDTKVVNMYNVFNLQKRHCE